MIKKGDLIKCIAVGSTNLTTGKIYEATGDQKGSFYFDYDIVHILDDDNVEAAYPVQAFSTQPTQESLEKDVVKRLRDLGLDYQQVNEVKKMIEVNKTPRLPEDVCMYVAVNHQGFFDSDESFNILDGDLHLDSRSVDVGGGERIIRARVTFEEYSS